MARKAGPDDGPETAPEGRVDVPLVDRDSDAPEPSAAFPSDQRAAEPLILDAGHSVREGEPSRVEAVSEEGLGVLKLGDPLGGTASGSRPWDPVPSDAAVPDASTGTGTALPGDARQPDRVPSEDPPAVIPAGMPETRPSTPDLPPSPGPSAAFAPPPVAPRRRGGFGGLFLGGMVAAALGFGAAWLAQDRLGLFPARLPANLEERLAALEARPVPDATALGALSDRIAETETRLSSLEAAPAPEPVAPVDLGPLREELTQASEAAQARVAELEERIAVLETRPAAPPAGADAPLGSLATPDPAPAEPPAPPVDPEALRQEVTAALDPRLTETETGLADARAALADLQTALADVDARLGAAEATSATIAEQARAAQAATAEVEARAAEAETQARIGGALTSVRAALDAGEPFEAALADLRTAGAEVPDTLTQHAAEGVPTLAALRETFPDAARAALEAARDQGLLEDGSGVLGFLRGQLSIRSVTPREGDDPDAVLSRAESAVSRGDLASALAQIDSLPEPVRAAMADWVAQARTRAEAEAALAGLAQARPAPETTPAD